MVKVYFRKEYIMNFILNEECNKIDFLNKEICSMNRKEDRYNKKRKYKCHLKKLSEKDHGICGSVCLVTHKWKNGEMVEVKKPYYKRIYRGKQSRYYKRQANRTVRRYQGYLNHGDYKRVFDFFYNVY